MLYTVITVVGIVLIMLFWLGGKRASFIPAPTGSLEVTVNDTKASIGIHRITPQPQSIDTHNATGRFTGQLTEGTYTITAKNNDLSAQQVVDIKSGETKKVNLTLSSLGTVEPVSSRGASHLVIEAAGMAFADRSNDNLYRIDASNNEQRLSNGVDFVSAQWSDLSYGVGQDNHQHLYRVTNTATEISAPFPYSDKTTYALAPNHDLYIADGNNLYLGKPEGGFKKIYSTSYQLSIMCASNNAVFLNEVPAGKKEGDLVTVDRSGTSKKIDGEAYNAAWSPSGNYVVISSDTKTEVLDSSLNEISQLPTTNVSAPSWLDDRTVLYGISDELWKYDITTHIATIMTKIGDIGQVSQIAPSKDGSYIYISVQKTTQNGDFSFELARLGLHGQPASPIMPALRLIVPNDVNGCSLGYTNFVRPAVNIYPKTASADACMQTARSYLQTYHIDLSQVQLMTAAP